MTSDVKFCTQTNTLKVTGLATVDYVNALRKAGCALMDKISPVVFDLQAITQCDSATLALLIAWTKAARLQNKLISFIHPPTSLRQMAHLSHVDGLLGFW